MRKTMLAIVGASAVALASAASAAVTVTAQTDLNKPNPTAPGAVVTIGNLTTINFGTNPIVTSVRRPGFFDGSFTFNNTDAGLYSIVLATSTPGVTFTSATLTNLNTTPGTCSSGCPLSLFPDNTSLKLIPAVTLPSGSFLFSFAGNDTTAGGALTGNLTILSTPAVPEPATWAMMLLGFGGIGFSARRSRKSPKFALQTN